MKKMIGILFVCFALSGAGPAAAQNPLIMDQFTADPTARVFEGRVYVYPSHDVNCGTNWFCMKDYHVFSSENLVDWTDHGMIVSQEQVAWVDAAQNSMWAEYRTVPLGAFQADLKYHEGGLGVINWFDAENGINYAVAMEKGASEAALVAAAEPFLK
mgnify:CR=1 FL=1